MYPPCKNYQRCGKSWATKFILLLCMVILPLASCQSPTPDIRCSASVDIEMLKGSRTRAENAIDRSCLHFSRRMGLDPHRVSASMGEVSVHIRTSLERTECKSGAQACVTFYQDGSAEVDASRYRWEILVQHEVYHILLYRMYPEINTDDHHSFMAANGLCSPEPRACGIRTGPL